MISWKIIGGQIYSFKTFIFFTSIFKCDIVIRAWRGLFALYIGEFGLLFYFLFALVISILLTYFFVSLVRIYENKMKRGLFFGYKDAVFQDIDSPIIAFNKRDKIFFVNNSARKFIAAVAVPELCRRTDCTYSPAAAVINSNIMVSSKVSHKK